MSRIYDVELSCGCLISTESNLLMECLSDDCKYMEEYGNKTLKSQKENGKIKNN